MGASLGRSLVASVREAGVGCPHCAADVALGDPVVVCQACGTVHHEACWDDRAAAARIPAPRRGGPRSRRTDAEPVLLITAAELDRAIPLNVGGLPHRAAIAAGDPDGRTRSPTAPPRAAAARAGSRPAGWRSPP